MAKSQTTSPSKKRKGSKAIVVFNVLFILVALIALVAVVLMVIPFTRHAIKELLKQWGWANNLADMLINWVRYHLVKPLGLSFPFRGHGYAFTSAFYLAAWFALLAVLVFFMYTPFLVMNHNRKLARKGKFRKVLCWITFVVSTLIFIGYLSIPYEAKITQLVGPAYTWFPTAYGMYTDLFKTGNLLAPLRLSFLTNNVWFNGTFYILVLLALFQIIMYTLACRIKPHLYIEEEPAEAAAPVEEETIEEVEPEVEPVPVPVAAVEEKPVEKKEERIIPSIRELALLNSLEPIEFSPVVNLPGLYDTDTEKLIDLLDPQMNLSLTRQELICKDAIEAKKLSERIEPKIKKVQTLPGIDEWNANPWEEEAQKVIEKVEEFPNPFEEPIEKPIPVAVPAEEPEPTPEPEPEPVKEPEPEPVVEEPIDETQKSEEVVAPEVEPAPVVEPEVVSREQFKVIVADNSHDEVKTEKFYKDNAWIVPEYPDEPEPVKEPEPEPKPVEISREKHKVVLADNSHEEVKTEKFYKDNTWIVPEYPDEPEPVKEPEPEPKPVEEKPAEPQKPVASVKQVELKKANPISNQAKPKIVPIAPITPAKEEEPTPVEEEKPVIAPISGPLHSTEKSRHGKIEVVKAKKVKFELQNYKIKTYEGDISAEDAFKMGVTKVQPTVNPVFANSASEPEWKRKKREDEIRKNGYSNIQKVSTLDGNVQSQNVNNTKATSIREMVKAQKAQEAAPKVETKVENKMAKPAAPIAVKPAAPVAPAQKPEEKKDNPFSDKQSPAFHPIAPIAKKETKRPTIKPVDPIKKK